MPSPSVMAFRSALQPLGQRAQMAWRNSYSSPAKICSAPVKAASGDGANIEPPNIAKLAQMAQVGVSEAEAAEWGPKISGIVDWFGQLQEIDLEGVPPALRADVENSSPLRPDQPVEFAHMGEMLSQVPDMDGVYVKVPKMTNQGEPEP